MSAYHLTLFIQYTINSTQLLEFTQKGHRKVNGLNQSPAPYSMENNVFKSHELPQSLFFCL